jgi:hypothetical protein
LKQQKKDLFFALRYCVQDNNWEEMPKFVELGEKLNVDKIIFQTMEDLGTMPDYKKRAVHLIGHPNRKNLEKMIYDPIFKKSFVKIQQLMKAGIGNERENNTEHDGFVGVHRLLEG